MSTLKSINSKKKLNNVLPITLRSFSINFNTCNLYYVASLHFNYRTVKSEFYRNIYMNILDTEHFRVMYP